MGDQHENWEPEDEQIVRRLRDEKPELSGLESDRIKTTVMARVKPSATRRGVPRSSILVALLTCGIMIGGTAGTIASSNSSLSGGTGAAVSQYKPAKCNPKKHDCHCPDHSVLVNKDDCACPPGYVFKGKTYDCVKQPSAPPATIRREKGRKH